MPVIAVFSGTYSAAEEIVQRVSDELDYAVVAHELVERASREFGVPADKLEKALAGKRGLFNPLTLEWEKSLIFLKAALAQLLRLDEQIYHGHATQLIPPSISHVLRVGVMAERDFRIARAVQEDGMAADDAARRITKADDELTQWCRLVLSSAPWNPAHYDILIPIPSTSIDDAVRSISDAVKREALKPTDESIQAVLDFQLATRVNLALLERGMANTTVRAERDRVVVEIHQGGPPQGKLARTVKAIRFESAEDEVRQICAELEGVERVEVRPASKRALPSRTLLVDDEEEYVMTLSERLDVRDIASDVVFDGQQALTFVKTDAPDVMVLDLRMPGIDGMEVLRRIKKDHPLVEVIIVTGHGNEKDEARAADLGAFDFLHKPVDINLLAQKINEASARAQRQRAQAEQVDGAAAADPTEENE